MYVCIYIYIHIRRPLPTAEGARQRKIVVSSESVFSLCHLGARRPSGSATLELEARSCCGGAQAFGRFLAGPEGNVRHGHLLAPWGFAIAERGLSNL